MALSFDLQKLDIGKHLYFAGRGFFKGSRPCVISDNNGATYAIDTQRLFDNPGLLKPFNPRYVLAINFWKLLSISVVVMGVVLSLTWQWWAFVPAWLLFVVIFNLNHASTRNYVIEIMQGSDDGRAQLSQNQLLWTVK